jgi:hypothetical protein
MTSGVDVITGWLTNTTALRVVPDTVMMRLWDTGVRLYALPYYATLWPAAGSMDTEYSLSWPSARTPLGSRQCQPDPGGPTR